MAGSCHRIARVVLGTFVLIGFLSAALLHAAELGEIVPMIEGLSAVPRSALFLNDGESVIVAFADEGNPKLKTLSRVTSEGAKSPQNDVLLAAWKRANQLALAGKSNSNAFSQTLQSVAAEVPSVQVHTGDEPVKWRSVTLNTLGAGFDAIRFASPLDEPADLYWAFVINTWMHCGITPARGTMGRISRWRQVYELELEGVHLPGRHNAVFIPLEGGQIHPAEEYLLWLRFQQTQPVVVHFAIKLTPAGKVSDSSTADAIAEAIGLKLPLRYKLTNLKVNRPVAASDDLSPPLAVAPFDDKEGRAIQSQWAEYLNVPVVQANSIGMKLVLIPPGECDIGSTPDEVTRLLEEGKQQDITQWFLDRIRSEAPRHRVKITEPFCLGLCEVTQAEYERVMGTNPSEFRGDPNRPVDNVSWRDAAEFCRKLSELPAEKEAGAAYRLPTEAEWEYACRAGTTTRYGFGDDAADLVRHGAWRSTSQGQSRPVGQLQPNAWGLLDMHGNLWEWCADLYAQTYYAESPTDDPQGPDSGGECVLRGGSWQSSAPTILRSAYRGGGNPDNKNRCLGFRVARAPHPMSR